MSPKRDILRANFIPSWELAIVFWHKTSINKANVKFWIGKFYHFQFITEGVFPFPIIKNDSYLAKWVEAKLLKLLKSEMLEEYLRFHWLSDFISYWLEEEGVY